MGKKTKQAAKNSKKSKQPGSKKNLKKSRTLVTHFSLRAPKA